MALPLALVLMEYMYISTDLNFLPSLSLYKSVMWTNFKRIET
jgi:hypothetical protein